MVFALRNAFNNPFVAIHPHNVIDYLSRRRLSRTRELKTFWYLPQGYNRG
jgi:hypothetical protein